MAIMIDTFREGYGTDQLMGTMTVGELIRFLEDFDEDEPIYLGFDNRYTVGGIRESMFDTEYEEDGE